MNFSVYIRQVERAIDVEAGSTILETALGQGIDYPHGCRTGNCGGCKSRLHSGDIEMSPYSPFALSSRESDDGLILACRTVPWSDCEVSWCEPDEYALHPVRELECKVSSITRLTEDTVSLKLHIESGGPFTHSPGQFTCITFLGMPKREYSIARQENDATLEFYIRKIEGGMASPYVVDHVVEDDLVHVEGPFGNMYYREDHAGPLLAIAGGSGLSAIQPIVLKALEDGLARPVYLYHGVRTEQDLYKSKLFEQKERANPNFRYIPVLSEETAATNKRTGMLFNIIDSEIKSTENMKAYMAGPPPMVSSCEEVLKQKGLPEEDIHADPFLTEADLAVQ